MKDRKNHNSILFLTTLGVYLGLVLVGAAPVLGHAATTRNFDIRDEIEFADELDNKPDDERTNLSISLQVYFEDIEYFLGNLQRLERAGKFDIRSDKFEIAQSTLLPCVANNKVGSYTANSFVSSNKSLTPALERFSKDLTDGYSLADCLPHERFDGKEATQSRFIVKFDESQLSIEIAVKKGSRTNAKHLTGDLARTFKLIRAQQQNAVRQRLFANTAYRSKNDQVFIVTRLPRAALDSLLAKDAK